MSIGLIGVKAFCESDKTLPAVFRSILGYVYVNSIGVPVAVGDTIELKV